MTQVNKIVKEFKNQLAEIYGARLKSVLVYGSWARNEATEDSDIDTLVVLAGDVSPGREIDRMITVITETNLKYGVLLSVYPVSEADFASLRSPLLMNARREGVPV